MKSRLTLFVAFLALVPSSLLFAGANSPLEENSPLGMNFLEMTYYTPEWVFTDAMKQSLVWLPQEANTGTWNTNYPLTLDANGWPILGTNPAGNPEAAGTLMYRDIDGRYPAGIYNCYYDGEGTIEFYFDAHTISQTPGHVVMSVDHPTGAGIFLKITSSKPSNYVRNIRLMLPGFDNSPEVFHPLFLQRMSPFKVLRFMKWQHTNDSGVPIWSERTLPSWQTQDQPGKGVAIEHMVDLCNALNANPWFCIRVTTGDDYVTQFANLVRQKLKPGLKVYVEHGNEIWNGNYFDFQYCIDKGVALGYDGNGAGPYLAGLRYHSERSVQIFSIFESVFGGKGQLVRVLGAQGANPWTGQQIMDWKNAYQHADALAIAPYFSINDLSDPNFPNMSVQQVINACAANIASVQNPFIAQNSANAVQRGLKLVAYEGGQHLVGAGANFGNPAVTALCDAVNKDPQMHDLYLQSLNGWKQNGGDMFCAFAAFGINGVWGNWAAMEHMDDSPSKSPKYKALLDYVATSKGANPNGIQFWGPVPGKANALNSISIVGAAPQSSIYLVLGLQPGSLHVPYCQGSSIGIGLQGLHATLLPSGADGSPFFYNWAPPALAGLPIYYQAVQTSSCGVSNLVLNSFSP